MTLLWHVAVRNRVLTETGLAPDDEAFAHAAAAEAWLIERAEEGFDTDNPADVQALKGALGIADNNLIQRIGIVLARTGATVPGLYRGSTRRLAGAEATGGRVVGGV